MLGRIIRRYGRRYDNLGIKLRWLVKYIKIP